MASMEPAPSAIRSLLLRQAGANRAGLDYQPFDPLAPPLVSLVTSLHVTADLVPTVHAVLGQSLQQWEWLLVGDPAQLDAARRQFDDDPRIRRILATTEDLAARRAQGIAAARADYMALIDPGDVLVATTLEQWLWFLKTHSEATSVAKSTIEPGAHAKGGTQPTTPRMIRAPESRSESWGDNRLKKHKPRLLFLIPLVGYGGGDKVDRQIVRSLVSHGWEVSVVVTEEATHPFLAELSAMTPDVFVLPRFLKDTGTRPFFDYLLRSRQPDLLLISHCEHAYHLLPWLRAEHPRLPILDLTHGVSPEWADGGFPRIALRFDRYLDGHVVSSGFLKRWLIAEGASADKVHVWYTGVDADLHRPNPARRARGRARLGIADDLPVILHVSRLSPEKQPNVLSSAIRLLPQLTSDFRLVLVGPKLPEVRRHFRGRPFNRVLHWVSVASDEELLDLYAAADVFFLPSAREGISVALLEAMANGLAVVVADVGGQSELVTAECGLLVQRSDPVTESHNYAAALAAILVDRSRLQAMKEAARARVESQFSLRRMEAHLDAFLKQAASTSSALASPSDDVRLANDFHELYLETHRLRSRLSRLDIGIVRVLVAVYRRVSKYKSHLLNWLRRVRDWLQDKL